MRRQRIFLIAGIVFAAGIIVLAQSGLIIGSPRKAEDAAAINPMGAPIGGSSGSQAPLPHAAADDVLSETADSISVDQSDRKPHHAPTRAASRHSGADAATQEAVPSEHVLELLERSGESIADYNEYKDALAAWQDYASRSIQLELGTSFPQDDPSEAASAMFAEYLAPAITETVQLPEDSIEDARDVLEHFIVDMRRVTRAWTARHRQSRPMNFADGITRFAVLAKGLRSSPERNRTLDLEVQALAHRAEGALRSILGSPATRDHYLPFLDVEY